MAGVSKGKIYKYDLNGNFVSEYESIESAVFIDKISASYLLEHLRGVWSFCHKHIYTKKYYIKLPSELLEHKTKRVYKRKELHQYDLDGNYLNSYKDKYEAEQKTGLKSRYIRDCARDHLTKNKSYGGFMWRFFKEKKIPKYTRNVAYTQIHQFTKDGKFVKTFNSLKEAAEIIGISYTAISACAAGSKNTPSAGGFIWKYQK
jgi:hypothetical protein